MIKKSLVPNFLDFHCMKEVKPGPQSYSKFCVPPYSEGNKCSSGKVRKTPNKETLMVQIVTKLLE